MDCYQSAFVLTLEVIIVCLGSLTCVPQLHWISLLVVGFPLLAVDDPQLGYLKPALIGTHI